jgi:hypothetical protein
VLQEMSNGRVHVLIKYSVLTLNFVPWQKFMVLPTQENSSLMIL